MLSLQANSSLKVPPSVALISSDLGRDKPHIDVEELFDDAVLDKQTFVTKFKLPDVISMCSWS
ncbi:MAG: hypothetical protein ACJAVI_003242 [Candidatus Azotimanducaceae bacterium]|jgi:hypothetical protein